MTTFENRLKAFENKYVHEKLLEFKVIARRNRMIGEWIAEKLHLSGNEKEEYTMNVVESDLFEVGESDIVDKILRDVKKSGVELTFEELKKKMVEFHEIAEKQIYEE